MSSETEDQDLTRDRWEYPGSHLKWGLLEKMTFNWPTEVWVDVYLVNNRAVKSIEIVTGGHAYYYLSNPFISRLPGDFGLAEKHVKAMFDFSDDEVLLIRAKSEQMTGDKAIDLQYPYGLLQRIGIIPRSWGEKKYDVKDWIASVEHYDELPQPSDLDIYRK